MLGLVRYQLGSGRANEHVDQHLVGGDDFLMAWHGSEQLDVSAAPEIAAYLDEPHKVFGTSIRSKKWAQNPQTGEREPVREVDPRTGVERVVYEDQHVWHCSLSLSVEEGVLSDEQWGAIAAEFMDEMGFTARSGGAPARWVAIRHGLSAGGNDHVHIAASMVREDGTTWKVWQRTPDGTLVGDYGRAQQACARLEAKHGLRVVEGRTSGANERGRSAAEERYAADNGWSFDDPKKELALRVRSAAGRASTEAEFVRRLRRDDVIVKPVFARGGTDVVTGWRAALKPTRAGHAAAAARGQKMTPRFYGGGHLGSDLSLPELRKAWPEPSVEDANDAAQEWMRAFKGMPPSTLGAAQDALTTEQWRRWAQDLQRVRGDLASVDPSDTARWSAVARDASRVLASWSRRIEPNGGPIGEAAQVLGRSGQLRSARPAPAAGSPWRGAAIAVAAASVSGRSRMAEAVLLMQMLAVMRAVHDAHLAAGRVQEARRIEEAVKGRLVKEVVPTLPVPDRSWRGTAPVEDRAPGEPPTTQRGGPTIAGLTWEERGGHPLSSPLPRTIAGDDRPRTTTTTTPKQDREAQR